MAQVTIEITRGKGQAQASFQPNPAKATTQDNVFWVNHDTAPHLPTRTDGTGSDQIWMKYQIPPEASSSGVAFFAPDVITKKQPPYTVEYFCAIDGHEGEKGTIEVTS